MKQEYVTKKEFKNLKNKLRNIFKILHIKFLILIGFGFMVPVIYSFLASQKSSFGFFGLFFFGICISIYYLFKYFKLRIDFKKPLEKK